MFENECVTLQMMCNVLHAPVSLLTIGVKVSVEVIFCPQQLYLTYFYFWHVMSKVVCVPEIKMRLLSGLREIWLSLINFFLKGCLLGPGSDGNCGSSSRIYCSLCE